VNCPKRAPCSSCLRAAVARGEVRPDAPVSSTARCFRDDHVPADRAEPAIADDYLVRIVDDVVMPLLCPA